MCVPLYGPFVHFPATHHLVLHLGQKVHMHQYMFACPPFPHIHPTALNSYMQPSATQCGPMCMSHPPLIWSHTLARRCTFNNTCIHVHLPTHICLTPFTQLYTNVCPYVAPCACPSHPLSGPTSWAEGTYASVHVCMSPQGGTVCITDHTNLFTCRSRIKARCTVIYD